MLDRTNRSWERKTGVYPETKHPAYFRSVGLPLEARLVEALKKHGYDRHPERVFLQSFEPTSCQALRKLTRLPIVLLVGSDAAGRARVTPEGLRAVRGYADARGLTKELVIPRLQGGGLGEPTSAVKDAHAADLKVHVWTFRPEDSFLPGDLKGKTEDEIRRFVAASIDGLFTDAPDVARLAVQSSG